jgi:hypothetical protein
VDHGKNLWPAAGLKNLSVNMPAEAAGEGVEKDRRRICLTMMGRACPAPHRC